LRLATPALVGSPHWSPLFNHQQVEGNNSPSKGATGSGCVHVIRILPVDGAVSKPLPRFRIEIARRLLLYADEHVPRQQAISDLCQSAGIVLCKALQHLIAVHGPYLAQIG
jgi:hypothetical protein